MLEFNINLAVIRSCINIDIHICKQILKRKLIFIMIIIPRHPSLHSVSLVSIPYNFRVFLKLNIFPLLLHSILFQQDKKVHFMQHWRYSWGHKHISYLKMHYNLVYVYWTRIGDCIYNHQFSGNMITIFYFISENSI